MIPENADDIIGREIEYRDDIEPPVIGFLDWGNYYLSIILVLNDGYNFDLKSTENNSQGLSMQVLK